MTLRPLRPTVLVLLDEEVEPLGPSLALAVAGRSRAAGPMLTGLRAAGMAPERFEAGLRASIEHVTRLDARIAALRAGAEVLDEVLLVLARSLGSADPAEPVLRAALEAAGRLGADFFRGTRIVVQAVLFLPDLRRGREAGYARAYEQLTDIEALGNPSALRLDAQPVVSRRWVCDCRTAGGAFAGTLSDLFVPVAEFLSTLVAGEAGWRQDEAHAPMLYGAAHERMTGYSAPGHAQLVFPRPLAEHLVACRWGADLATRALHGPGHEDGARRGIEDLSLLAVRTARTTLGKFAWVGHADTADPTAIRDHWEEQRQSGGDVLRGLFQELLKGMARKAGAVIVEKAVEHFVGTGPERAGRLSEIGRTGEAELRGSLQTSASELNSLADQLDADAEQTSARAAEAERRAEDPDAPFLEARSGDASAGALRERAALLRRRASVARRRAERLRGVLSESADVHAMEAALAEVIAEDEAELDGEEGEAAGELDPDADTAGGLRIPVPPVIPTFRAILGGSGGALLYLQWLLWLAEFGLEARRYAKLVAAFRRDLEWLAAYYEREAEGALRRIGDDGPFRQSLLSKRKAAALFDATRAPRRSGEPALLKRLASTMHTRSQPGRWPVATRFARFDRELHEAARRATGGTLPRTLVDALHDQGAFLGGLRAGAEPLARPHGTVEAARVSLLLHPPQMAEAPGLEMLETDARAAEPHPYRVEIRTALHGFPAHALPQLRPLRASRVADGGAPPEHLDPLPRPARIDPAIEELIALGVALDRIAVTTEGRLQVDGLPPADDEVALAHTLQTTFAGHEIGRTLRGHLRLVLAGEGALDRLAASINRGTLSPPLADVLRNLVLRIRAESPPEWLAEEGSE